MWRKSLVVVLIIAAVIAMVNHGAEADPEYSFKLAHVQPQTHPYEIAAQAFAKEVAERSNGKIQVISYHSGQLGSGERDLFEGAQLGTIDFAIGVTQALANFEPAFSCFDLPLLFDDKPHVYKVLDSDFGRQMLDKLDGVGLKGLAYWECGFVDVIGNVRIAKPEDLKGTTMRAMESSVYIKSLSLFGMNPVPMAFGETFTSLQNGTIDGSYQTIPVAYSNNMHTICKYYSPLNFAYCPLPLVMNKDKFDALPSDLQKVIAESAVVASVVSRTVTTEKEPEQIKEFPKAGCEVLSFTKEELEEWKNFARKNVWPVIVKEGGITQEILNMVESLR
jgi:tripartite ATP-independent transporter DctP family solute receptor